MRPDGETPCLQEKMSRLRRLARRAAIDSHSAAHAQEWPTRPVTLVVPFAAGGPVDTAARIMAARLSENLGQQVIVENVSGAGSMMGGNRVAKAAPDGYTFLHGNRSTHIYSQILSKKPMYDAVSRVRAGRGFRRKRRRPGRAQGFPGGDAR